MTCLTHGAVEVPLKMKETMAVMVVGVVVVMTTLVTAEREAVEAVSR